MFSDFLHNLRAQGLGVGLSEWLVFLRGLRQGLAGDVQELYHLGRSLLVHSEAHYDLYDVAFSLTFGELVHDPRLAKALDEWLAKQKELDPELAPGAHDFEDLQALLDAFRETLEQQKERHEGGNRWVGTGGTSPYGTGGIANQGLQLGDQGGRRSGVRLADERRWKSYRTDVALGVRDFELALRALRALERVGEEQLDLPETIDQTAKNAGEIELAFQRERKNRLRVALFMDSGGSMTPYAQLVSRLFSAAVATKTFKSLSPYYFHNCVYQWLHEDYEVGPPKKTADVLAALTPEHRLIFVGDASMADWELFPPPGRYSRAALSGLEWLQAFARKCRASVWLNPEPEAYWDHSTVSAIGGVFRMYPLTIDGLRDAVRFLKAPT